MSRVRYNSLSDVMGACALCKPKITTHLEADGLAALKVQQTVVAHHNGKPAASVNHGWRHFKRSVIVFQS